MSFLTAVPQELAAAAAQLGAIGSALAAQNAGAAAPTTAIAPAAADQVSIIQSGIFTAYGALYQQVSAEAQAIQEQFVQTLGLSSGTYEQSEAANAAAATLTSGAQAAAAAPAAASPVDSFLNTVSTLIGGPLTSVGGQPFSLSGNTANITSFQIGNWTSAGSDLFGLFGGGLMSAPADAGADAAGAAAEGAEGAAVGEVGAVGTAGGGAPVAAGLGGATTVGAMSVPPSWAAGTTLVSSTGPSALSGAGWTAAAPAAATGSGFYPGMPGMASAARNSAGFGAPRYGVKPIVMPKPVAV
ncbi:MULTISPECIES: PPE family protein, SVP subgroup [Mycobacterium]|uniref:PPE family protein, SVP subgroup n=1 Tax=Mycobacterium TaxID=1763 RepID=UPI001EE2BC99|nr:MULTISPECIES: PE domain-containing protein [Mycobacterium]BDE17130.1 PE family protein [Mycobacterium sp. 20KCMC460]GLB92671.1 PE family protein [Mycobacterium kiyosense]GLC04824.1 PE family protein [Mycobacterium kiyosense]GLC10616.1 PE family protein [Mycobacterium kiyosense]GLC16579.1 PE family protein [Mycobacterium kiyosense]